MRWSPQQDSALLSVRRWLRDPGAPQVFRLFGYAGTGKSTLARELAKGVKDGVIYCAFTGKAALVMRRRGCTDASTVHSAIYTVSEDEERPADEPLFVLNPESPVATAGLVVLDECFPAGTLVDTPTGPRAIESLLPGDAISNASGSDVVVATSTKEVESLVLITVGKTEIACSANHPFFTSRGLVNAADIEPGDRLLRTASAVRLLRGRVSAKCKEGVPPVLRAALLDALVDAVPRVPGAGLHARACGEMRSEAQSVSGFWRVGCPSADRPVPGDATEPTARSQGRNQRPIGSNRTQAEDTGRERPADCGSSARVVDEARAGVASGAYCSDGAASEDRAHALQAGHRQPGDDGGDRGGRRLSLHKEGSGCGQKEGSVSDFHRVDRAEVLQPGDPRLDRYRNADGRLRLYDLQAARHSSFSVAGCLVHNCSMIDEGLGRDLLSFGTRVLVLGDPAQLPPVKGEGFFTACKPDIMLTEIHRQAADNPIIHLATKVRRGERIEVGAYGASRVVPRGGLDREDFLAADQVLVGRNRTRESVNRWFRQRYGRSSPLPEVGDRLVCLRNDKEKRILNGELFDMVEAPPPLPGEKKKRRKPDPAAVDLWVRSEDAPPNLRAKDVRVRREHFLGGADDLSWHDRRGYHEFTYGYALTVHKSQGSQWDNVLVCDESSVFRENSRNHLYTALTRAADRVTVVQQ